ncbi:DUF1592 domain-containing protein [Neorhodopirellula pilleata]|uniref:Planctomycete cytochrome C n=1 Tax=Neorhodopirellula pilleata TaxID=2714738 RepID=A0A5C6AKM5_9BACT|nr:DUF1592 domain-containing protein [Neorhodopirellula pilleata]TWT98733.1 hypothetical protein Pla100_18980 [Neorhodopirellula pilleata]
MSSRTRARICLLRVEGRIRGGDFASPVPETSTNSRRHWKNASTNYREKLRNQTNGILRNRPFLPIALILLGMMTWRSPGYAADPFAEIVEPFLAQYCAECHADDQSKGDRNFDSMASRIDSDNDLVDFQDIVDQLNLSEMPPPEADQPSDDERRNVIATLGGLINAYHQTRTSTTGDTVLRRLNAREYHNTIRDLLQINTTVFDPTEGFPADQLTEHVDTVGESLVTSSHLLTRYLQAARRSVEKAIYPVTQPPVQEWEFDDNFKQQPELDSAHKLANQWKHIRLYDVRGADKPEGAYAAVHDFRQGVPNDGMYEIKIDVEALNRNHPFDDTLVGTDRDRPFRLGIVSGTIDAGDLHLSQPNEATLAEFELRDGRQSITAEVWLDEGYTPRFTFENGVMDARNLWTKIVRKYPDQFPKGTQGIVDVRKAVIKQAKIPQIRVHRVEIRGPLFPQWPRASQTELFGEYFGSVVEGKLDPPGQRRILESFLSRAFRRTPGASEVERYHQFFQTRLKQTGTMTEAFGQTFQAILCSPHFLYLDDQPAATERESPAVLTSPALASRLSYFLWSTMPDEDLLRLARDKSLSDPQKLHQQARRMLDDPRSDAFVEDFLDSWLTLRDLGSAPPDRGQFNDYYRYDLETAMRRETFFFTRHILDHNRPITEFIHADYTYVNDALAKLYQIPFDGSHEFERVPLADRRRGGLLGHASVLTVSANGFDTSPVVRGVWLLENVLGTPPTPPPPDVEPLDPDTRGAKTIRDQLRKHRETASCYDCHRKIDPLGFALENYDAIGRWRNQYDRKAKIDASGELPDGQSFENAAELKLILANRDRQLTRALTEKLLTYATGRPMTITDRPWLDRIVEENLESGNGMKDLVLAVILSEPFGRE